LGKGSQKRKNNWGSLEKGTSLTGSVVQLGKEKDVRRGSSIDGRKE